MKSLIQTNDKVYGLEILSTYEFKKHFSQLGESNKLIHFLSNNGKNTAVSSCFHITAP